MVKTRDCIILAPCGGPFSGSVKMGRASDRNRQHRNRPGKSTVNQETNIKERLESTREGGDSLVEFLRKSDRWWTILLLLFFVTAALGLPVLWISRSYNPLAKILLSIAVLLYTGMLFWGVWLIIAWSYGRIMNPYG